MSKVEQDSAAKNPAKGSSKIKWIVAGLLLVFAGAAAMMLPRGFSDDLSLVGKGKVAVVLVRDKNAVESFDMLEVMNGIRDQYAGRVEFLLTDFNTPEGRAFISANKAARVTMVVLDANGNTLNVLYPRQTAESVKQVIDGALGAAK